MLYWIENSLEKDFKTISKGDKKIYQLVDNAKQCMDMVSNGKADIFIGSLGTVSYLLKEQQYVNLKIAR